MSNADDKISDVELFQIVLLQTTISEMTEKMKALAAEEEALSEAIMGRLRAGATCTGTMQAFIDKKTGRSTPAWKDEFITHMMKDHGAIKKDIEAQMKAKYPAKQTEILAIANVEAAVESAPSEEVVEAISPKVNAN